MAPTCVMGCRASARAFVARGGTSGEQRTGDMHAMMGTGVLYGLCAVLAPRLSSLGLCSGQALNGAQRRDGFGLRPGGISYAEARFLQSLGQALRLRLRMTGSVPRRNLSESALCRYADCGNLRGAPDVRWIPLHGMLRCESSSINAMGCEGAGRCLRVAGAG